MAIAGVIPTTLGSFLGHAGNIVADDELELRAESGLNKHITRIKQPFDHFPLAILSHDLALYGHKHLRNLILQFKPLDFFHKIFGGLLFLASCCPKDIPFHVTHGNRNLQRVNRCHEMLESEVDYEEHQGK